MNATNFEGRPLWVKKVFMQPRGKSMTIWKAQQVEIRITTILSVTHMGTNKKSSFHNFWILATHLLTMAHAKFCSDETLSNSTTTHRDRCSSELTTFIQQWMGAAGIFSTRKHGFEGAANSVNRGDILEIQGSGTKASLAG